MFRTFQSAKCLLLLALLAFQVNQSDAQSISFNNGDLEIILGAANDSVILEGYGKDIAVNLKGDWLGFEDVQHITLDTSDGKDVVVVVGEFDASAQIITGNDDDTVFVSGIFHGAIFRVTESTGPNTIIRDATGDDQVVFENCQFANIMGFELGSGKNNVSITNTTAYRQAIWCEFGELEATLEQCEFYQSDVRVSYEGSIDASYNQVDVVDVMYIDGFFSTSNPGNHVAIIGEQCRFGKFSFLGGAQASLLSLSNCDIESGMNSTFPIQIRTGNRGDEIELLESDFGSDLSIETSGGGDTVLISDIVNVDGDVTVDTGDNVDEIEISEHVNIFGDLTIASGTHSDQVVVTNTNVIESVNIETGSGSDTVRLTRSTVTGNCSIELGGDNDTLYVYWSNFYSLFFADGQSQYDRGNEYHNKFYGGANFDSFESGNMN